MSEGNVEAALREIIRLLDAARVVVVQEANGALDHPALDAIEAVYPALDALAALRSRGSSDGECHGDCGREYANYGCPRCRSLREDVDIDPKLNVPLGPERGSSDTRLTEALRELARKDRLLQMIVDDNFLLGREDDWERLAVRHIVTARAALAAARADAPQEQM